jgi:hypothetical protein
LHALRCCAGALSRRTRTHAQRRVTQHHTPITHLQTHTALSRASINTNIYSLAAPVSYWPQALKLGHSHDCALPPLLRPLRLDAAPVNRLLSSSHTRTRTQ